MSEAAILSLDDRYWDLPGGETLNEALLRRAHATPRHVHLHLRQDDGSEQAFTYEETLAGARSAAGALRARGLKPQETVAIMLPTCREFFFTFLGTLLAGGIPVPIYPPIRADQLEEYARRQSGILRNAEVCILVTFKEAERIARLLDIPSLRNVVRGDELVSAAPADPDYQAKPEDIALIQYTSGSTGDPKGVTLTHRNLVSNVRAIGYGVGVRPGDVVVSWLPLYHDMGLIGCWLFSIYFGLELAAISPVAFLRRPERWLWMFHHHRGTLSPAPNFGYELCVRKVKDKALEGLDLSSWRVALNGAEPIHPGTLDGFIGRFSRYGFRSEAMMPVYGLAENSVALSFSPRGTAPRIDVVDRSTFELRGEARPARESGGVRRLEGAGEAAGNLRFVSAGRALPGHEIRIVDHAGGLVGERREGQVQFRGVSAMQGYYRNPAATRAAMDGDWYRSGDLGYWAEGDLFITGRHKDLIIRAGRNVHPQELEKLAAEVTGVRQGCVAAFSVPDLEAGTESVVIVAETREKDPSRRREIAGEVKRRVGAGAISPDVVMVVSSNTIPKTPSGKLQRDACRRLYVRGELERRGAPAWVQVGRLAARSAFARAISMAGRVFRRSSK
jgi:fatty-acyl-CoA synthase